MDSLLSDPINLLKKQDGVTLIPCPKLAQELLFYRQKTSHSNQLLKNPKMGPLLSALSVPQSVLSLQDLSHAFLKAMPAADLHIHGGALADVNLATDISWQRSLDTDRKLIGIFGEKERLVERLLKPKPGQLGDYLTLYHLVRDYLFTNLDDIRTICREGALNAFYNGTTLLEVRSSIKSGPFGDPACRHTMTDVNFTPEQEFEAMVEGFESAQKACHGFLKVYLTIAFRRGDQVENIMNSLNQAVQIREHIRQKFGYDYIRGIDIAGAEYGNQNKAKRLKEVFARAKEKGFHLTAHAGEEVDEGSILQALNHLQVDRIGHGTSLHLPTPLLDNDVVHTVNGEIKNSFIRLLQRGVPFETCLTSNLICGARVTRSYVPRPGERPEPLLKSMTSVKEYPFEILIAFGDCVAPGKAFVGPLLSTDGIFTLNTSLAREYSLAASEFDLGISELLYLNYLSIQHSFAPSKTKDEILQQSFLPFAGLFLGETEPKKLLNILEEKALHWRQKVRHNLGLHPKDIERIRQEVADSKSYEPVQAP